MTNLRFCLLFGSIAVVAAWEGLAPRRPSTAALRVRWLNNFAVWILGTAVALWAFPLGLGFAVVVAERGSGLLHLAGVPFWLAFVVSVLVLDLARYGEHALYHRMPLLWRFHRMHHADTEYDFSVGLRFHPVEALVSVVFSAGVVAVLGPPVAAVLMHQLVMLVSSTFEHANGRLPARWDALLRLVIVTPDMHRVHHSTVERETNSNLGNLFPWWDRLFGSYVAQPAEGHEAMIIGLGEFRDAKHRVLPWMLMQPLLPAASQNSSNASPSA